MIPELETWQLTSLYAFLVRSPDALRIEASRWSGDIRDGRASLLRLGIELDVLELDLKLTVDELRMAYETLYAAAAVTGPTLGTVRRRWTRSS
ncbi:MAG: hypothetical protein DMD89_33255 [Candidatus Rokuibacteriota bacterium]|nr:MAG: hypothetical protein DMD89_33255 [Candidatus Rokubacteria bacterium]